MLQSYVLSSILTLSLTYSWYSFYGVRFDFKSRFFQQDKMPGMKPVHVVPVYMWDIYNNGVNSSEVDTVKGIHPMHVGSSVKSRLFRNHRRKQLEFRIPEGKEEEVLVKAEVRITTSSLRNGTTSFQIYLKTDKWIFLDEEKVSGVEVKWVSLGVTPFEKILKPGSVVTFLIVTLLQNGEENCCGTDFSHPVLLLSYISRSEVDGTRLKREKRNLEDYEEETNRIWEDGIIPREISKTPERKRNGCRRKSLYIKFSEIDYDSWIVAPSGYEAFQCVGKCNFPVGEHLSPTKHAILQTLLHNINPWKVSRACCVPTRLDPISILYLDENGVLTYRFRYRDMVVAECGCR